MVRDAHCEPADRTREPQDHDWAGELAGALGVDLPRLSVALLDVWFADAANVALARALFVEISALVPDL